MIGYSRREFLAASARIVVNAGWLGSSQVSPATETVVSPGAAPTVQPIEIPAWAREVTRMSFLEDYGIDGYSFDGNYHPPICYCAACLAAYQRERGRTLPVAVDLEQIEYPYQRMLLARAVQWAAGGPPPIRVQAPRCVQTTFYERTPPQGPKQLVIHRLNMVKL